MGPSGVDTLYLCTKLINLCYVMLCFNYPIDLNQHTLQEILRRMKGEPKAVLLMIAVEDQIMSLKTVWRFFDNAMLTA